MDPERRDVSGVPGTPVTVVWVHFLREATVRGRDPLTDWTSRVPHLALIGNSVCVLDSACPISTG